MKSIFRIYAKTSKGNDSYLYNQLHSFGLKPKHEDLLHSFYFNANFNQLFKLSFQSFTVENLYLQIGHKYPLSSNRGEGQKSLGQFFKKTNFRNYIRLERGLIQNISLKILIRQSSTHLPSENAIVSILENCLQKEIIMKQYRNMNQGEQGNHLQNYYDIKQIVQKKWQHQSILKQQKQLRLQNKNTLLINNSNTNILQQNNNQSQSNIIQLPNYSYSPHFILYIRRNHARILLKLNKQSMHKFGWKKNIGWGPLRQTLAASILYRSGLIDHFRKNNLFNLCDPFCGSSTLPMVGLSMMGGFKVRQDYKQNFIWQNWPIYKQKYLIDYLQEKQKQNKDLKIKILIGDVDISAVQNSINNLKQFVKQNKDKLGCSKNEAFIEYGHGDKIFQIYPNAIYIGCSDFQKILQKFDKKEKINIITNLPYLGERSKSHHPIKQLNSIYKRFSEMIKQNKQNISNVFVIVDADLNNQNHFIQISKEKWTILDRFYNGGLQVCLLAWQDNQIRSNSIQLYDQNVNKTSLVYDSAKMQNLTQYRKKIRQITNKQYDIPEHFKKYKGLRGFRRVQAKRKARQLRAAYIAFAERKDKNQIFEKYAKKNLAIRLSQRGKTWKRKNISLMQNDLGGKQQIIKKQFECRIEEALKKSQELKDRKKQTKNRVLRRW